MPETHPTATGILLQIHKTSDVKIIIVGPAWPLRGGIANFNESLCRQLLSEGHDVQIVSFTMQYPSFLFPGTSQKEAGGGTTDLPVKALINSISPASWYKTAKYIRNLSPDLVIIRYWLPFMAPALGTIARKCKSSNTKVIGLTDNILPHEKRPFDHSLTSYFVKACDGFLVMSEEVKNDLAKFVPDKPVVKRFHPVYDIFGTKVDRHQAREKLQFSQTDRIILFFGFIRNYKGLDLLLEAMADENVKQTGARLIVAGEFYEDRKPYDRIVEKHHLGHRVKMSGEYIPKESVRYYFSSADLVVQPYRTATQSGVTQIAYNFGIPMVVTSVGGLPEMVPDNISGLVCETTAKSVAEKIAAFFNNNKLQDELASGVRSKAPLFSWKEFTSGIELLMQKIEK